MSIFYFLHIGHEIRTRIWNQDAGFIDDGTAQMDEMYLSHVGFIQQGRSLLNKTLIVGVYEKTSNNGMATFFRGIG